MSLLHRSREDAYSYIGIKIMARSILDTSTCAINYQKVF